VLNETDIDQLSDAESRYTGIIRISELLELESAVACLSDKGKRILEVGLEC